MKFSKKAVFLLFLSLFFSCNGMPKNYSPQMGINENIENMISSYIVQFMTGSLGETSDNYPLLFIEAFNDRINLNRNLHDENILARSNRLKEEAFVMLNDALSNEGWYSDGQDARRGDFKKIISYMTLAILSPELQNDFIDSAKAVSYGETWYDYPRKYTVVVFLDVLLKLDRYRRDFKEGYPIIIEMLNELNRYLLYVIESQSYDNHPGTTIEFINSIIHEINIAAAIPVSFISPVPPDSPRKPLQLYGEARRPL